MTHPSHDLKPSSCAPFPANHAWVSALVLFQSTGTAAVQTAQSPTRPVVATDRAGPTLHTKRLL